jgi:hypothetical protein
LKIKKIVKNPISDSVGAKLVQNRCGGHHATKPLSLSLA